MSDPFFNVTYPVALKNDVNMLTADDSHLVNIRLAKDLVLGPTEAHVQRGHLQPVQRQLGDELRLGRHSFVELRRVDQLRAGESRPARREIHVLIETSAQASEDQPPTPGATRPSPPQASFIASAARAS